MVELYGLGSTGQSIADAAKVFERRKCNHRDAIANDDCLRSVVGMSTLSGSPSSFTECSLYFKHKPGESNKHRYVVASQSSELRTYLRAIPFVPIIHINRVVMVLEPPSEATQRAKALVSICISRGSRS